MAGGKKYPILALVSIGILAVSGILEIVALACPYWHVTDAVSSGRSIQLGHYGLWVVCFTYDQGIVSCTSDYLVESGWLKAVRAMNILGLMFGCGALIMTGFYAFVYHEKWTKIFKSSAVCSALLSGLLILIGAVVYGVSISQGKSRPILPIPTTTGAIYSYTLNWSFALSIVAAIFVVVSGILVGFAQSVRK